MSRTNEISIPDPLRILVAQEDRVAHYYLHRALRFAELAADVRFAFDAEQAIAELATDVLTGRRLDLLLVDLSMPRGAGLEILDWLSSQPAVQEAAVVVLISSQPRAEIERALYLGVSASLAKPTTPEEFIALVRSLPAYAAMSRRQSPAALVRC